MSRSARVFLFLLLLVVIAVYQYYKHPRIVATAFEAITIDDSLSGVYAVFDSCPPEGDAMSARIGELNKLKNRFSAPRESDFIEDITLDKILELGEDRDRWSNDKAARIKGYIYDVKSGGVETCNCKEREDQDKDTHIEIVADPMQTSKTKRMVIEVTPRMRDIMEHNGEDWSTRALRDRLLGRWVEVEGWLLFDDEHEMNAENTNPGRPRNWRATAWELHPLTNIKVVEHSLP